MTCGAGKRYQFEILTEVSRYEGLFCPYRRHAAARIGRGAGAPRRVRRLHPHPARPLRRRLDEEYTRLIKEYLQDPRITTELVDHMPASDTVPSPLKFLGRIPGKPGELTYAKDIHRYYEALAKASPRAKFWKIGQTEEGRDQVILAIADEATIRDLDKYKDILAKLGDPRKITDEQARELIKTGKPIYYAASGIHSPETGGPEMLIELAYRLIVEESPFIQTIRNNMITFITPVIETDGREKQVDTYYFNKKLPEGAPRLPLMYWGKYVQHDNNRDGMGQYLKITQNFTKAILDWHPTVLHDLHEAQSYLYVSTGTGPYNTSLDPVAIDEWWLLAQTEVMEMAKRGVPGVFTYGFYDGWVPNYLFWIALTHNSFGRFYEVQSYGPDVNPNLQLQRHPDQPRMVPAESAASFDQVGAAKQHQYPGIGAAAGAQPGRSRPRAVPGELLDEEQALDRKGKERSDLRVGDSGRPAPQSRRCRHGERPAEAGRGGAPGHRRFQGRQHRGSGRRLYHPRGPALPNPGGHVFQCAELSACQSAAVRRHRLDHAVHAQREE